jgi:hypothetical protein
MVQLQVCFWLGYFGYCNAEPGTQEACFLDPKNPALATYVVLLMGTAKSGATLKSAIDMVGLTVLASVVGQLLFVLLGWCTLWGRLSVLGAMFCMSVPLLFLAFSGGPSAAIGTKLAAISSMFLLKPCSAETLTHASYSADYHGLINILVAVLVMGFLNVLMGDKRAAESAAEELVEAISQFQGAFRDALQGSTDGCADNNDAVQKKLAVVQELAQRADNEPELWHDPWRPGLCKEIHTCFSSLSGSLNNFLLQVKDDRSGLLDVLPNYKAISEELVGSLDRMAATSIAILDRDVAAQDKQMREPVGTGTITAFDALIKDMNAQATKGAKSDSKVDAKEMRLDTSTQLCVIAQTLRATMSIIQAGEDRIVGESHKES